MSEPAADPTRWEKITAGIQATFAPPLRAVLEPLDRWIDGLPEYVPQACAVSLFVIAGLSALCIRREFVYRGAPDRARWRDLRVWSAVLMLPYITVYVLWGRGVPSTNLPPPTAPAAEVASPTAPLPTEPSH